MICSECGAQEPTKKTVRWVEEAEDAEERPLCDRCCGPVAAKVLIVPGPAYCFGTYHAEHRVHGEANSMS